MNPLSVAAPQAGYAGQPEMEYGPGDFAIMAPGHDAWIVGDEPCVVVDWQGFADYAKP